VEKENPASLVGSGNRADINAAQHSVDSPPSPAAQDWRSLLAERGITVHPAADELKMMSDAELDALGEDIVAHSIRVRIVFVGDQLLDGRNRVAAICRISSQRRRDRLMKQVLERDRALCLVLPDGTDPSAVVVSSNILRRHLDRGQKRGLIEKLAQSAPGAIEPRYREAGAPRPQNGSEGSSRFGGTWGNSPRLD
jgi:hypothetical protein